MKTQLLQDFQESGSAQAPPPHPPEPPPQGEPAPAAPARPARPAVWHGPGAQRPGAGPAEQRADPGAMQRAPDTQARGVGVAIEAWAERTAQHRPLPDDPTVPGQQARASHVPPPRQPEPSPRAFDHVPPPRPPEPAPEPRIDAGIDPGTIPRPTQPDAEAEWLAARLRDDAARREEPAWSSVWKRRLVTWSIAGSLLAALAAGGLWLYEENRVDGALVVVANTSAESPAPTPAPAPASRGAQAFAAGSPAPVSPLPVQAPPADAVKPLPAPPEPDAATTPAPAPALDAPATPTAGAAAAPVDVSPPPRRAPHHASSARRHGTAQARRAHAQDEPAAAAAPSARQRREETLMQCRAHGYDERQCFQHGCLMTRYGLACRG